MDTWHLVCDLSDVTSIWGAEAPDIVITGGFAIPDRSLLPLSLKVQRTKHNLFGDSEYPIKWNLRDTKRALELHGLRADGSTIQRAGETARQDLLRLLCEAEARFFLSVLMSHSVRKRILAEKRAALSRYSFSNLLMRAGLFRKTLPPDTEVQVLLDWPEGNDRKPFVEEYLSAWKHGRSGDAASSNKYHCGPLRELQFRPGLHFGITDIDSSLQLADLVTGSGRCFVEFAMGRAEIDSAGVRCFSLLLPSFYCNQQGKILGTGIAVSPLNSGLQPLLEKGLERLKSEPA